MANPAGKRADDGGAEKNEKGRGHAPARAAALDDDALMLFADGLRAQLPDADEIIARAASRKRGQRLVGGAALLAVAAAGLFVANPAYRTETIATAPGERGAWTLDDGSEVSLNTDSRLTVEYRLRSRELHLPQGEALFRVSHPRMRSFIVYANHLQVEDIGTVFNVRNTKEGARVTVLEGQVWVRSAALGAAAEMLGVGQGMEAQGERLLPFAATDLQAAAAWREGKLIFNDAPLAQVVAELQRYRTMPLLLSPALADGPLRITGQFDIDHLDQLIGMLPKLAPISTSRRQDGSIVIFPRGEMDVPAAPPAR